MIETPVKKTPQRPGQDMMAPVQRRKKRQGATSEYKKSLQEKQTLKRLYGMTERQFKRYVKETLEKVGTENMSDSLIRRLEKRLDNVVFRLAFAKSRPHARQLVSHAYFLVNGKSVNIASFQVQKGDVISLKDTKKKKTLFNDLSERLKKAQVSSWLTLDAGKLEGKVVGEPNMATATPPVEMSLIFEFYSR